MAALSYLRMFDSTSHRFRETSPESLIQYVIMMFGELRDKSLKAPTQAESQWYSDLAAIFLEVGCRYDELRPISEPRNASER